MGQPGQARFVFYHERKRVGRIQHIFRKARAEQGLFFGNLFETGLLVLRQFGAGETEVAQFVLNDFFACRGQRGKFRCAAQGAILVEQIEVLAEVSPILGDVGQAGVVGVTQRRAVDHGVQMPDHAPGARQFFVDRFERCDDIAPAAVGRGGHPRQCGAALHNQVVYCRGDMLRPDIGEARKSGKIK